jgi:hypothetical protein
METRVHKPSHKSAGPSLWTALRVFFSFHEPAHFAVVIPLPSALRLWLGNFGWWDLAVIPLILALQPFAEWLIHVYILHFKPKKILGRVARPAGRPVPSRPPPRPVGPRRTCSSRCAAAGSASR